MNAKTFSVHATDGKDYDFVVPSSCKADMNEINDTHFAKKEQIEVKYKSGTPPYACTSAD